MTLRLGTNENDRFSASNGNDVFLGFAGSDIIETGTGLDIVGAGDGDDTIVVSGYSNKFLRGGAGNDAFEFASDTKGLTKITDFEDGKDVIDLSDFGVTDISELKLQSMRWSSPPPAASITTSSTPGQAPSFPSTAL